MAKQFELRENPYIFMLLLRLNRIYKTETYTIGNLFVRDHYFCDTLEDKVRILNTEKDKIKKQTAIPAGCYKVILSFSPHFQCVMPELLDVPYFKSIRIHWGNDIDDTDGCVLVGENKQKGKVLNSKATYKRLMEILEPVFKSGEEIYIQIIE